MREHSREPCPGPDSEGNSIILERAEILEFQGTWVQILILPVTSGILVDNLLSELQVSPLYNWGKNISPKS